MTYFLRWRPFFGGGTGSTGAYGSRSSPSSSPPIRKTKSTGIRGAHPPARLSGGQIPGDRGIGPYAGGNEPSARQAPDRAPHAGFRA